MKKGKIQLAVISILITLLINSVFIISVSFIFEKEAPVSDSNTNFLGILRNNTERQLTDYCLLNWEYSKENRPLATNLPNSVLTANFERTGRVEAVAVQLLQNKFNSIIQLYSVDIYNAETQGNSAGNVEFVKLFGNYYIIVGYTLEFEDEIEYSTAVFKTNDDISDIKELKTEKKRFYSYHFYPLSLSPLFATPLYKILNVSFVIGEILLIYFILAKKQQNNHKQGPIRTH